MDCKFASPASDMWWALVKYLFDKYVRTTRVKTSFEAKGDKIFHKTKWPGELEWSRTHSSLGESRHSGEETGTAPWQRWSFSTIVLSFLIFLSFLSYLSLYFIIFSYLLLSCPILSYLFHPLSRSCSLFIFPDPLLWLHPGPSQLRARVRRGERLHQEAVGARPLQEEHSGPGLTTPLADRQ